MPASLVRDLSCETSKPSSQDAIDAAIDSIKASSNEIIVASSNAKNRIQILEAGLSNLSNKLQLAKTATDLITKRHNDETRLLNTEIEELKLRLESSEQNQRLLSGRIQCLTNLNERLRLRIAAQAKELNFYKKKAADLDAIARIINGDFTVISIENHENTMGFVGEKDGDTLDESQSFSSID